jgi:tetratricopeptide (TPR) repeat protein
MGADTRTMWTSTLIAVCLASVAVVAGGHAGLAPAAPTTRLTEVRELYEAAEYERALALAGQPDPSPAGSADARDIRVYEALCLLALGNRSRAAATIDEILRADPEYQPSPELPKRLKGLVDEVRDELRPALTKSHYLAGKDKLAAGDYQAASKEFSMVLELADAPHDGPRQDYADLRLLAGEFREIAERGLVDEKLAAAKVAVAKVTQEPPVIPPVVIRQDVPPWPAVLATARNGDARVGALSGLLEIVITREGTVGSARLTKRIHPLYDARLIDAAKQWRYQPATRGGAPIEYLKRLEITVR